MRGKRKNHEGPHRLTDFFGPAGAQAFQDGAGAATLAHRQAAAAASSKGNSHHSHSATPGSEEESPPSDFSSPLKQGRKLTANSETVSDPLADTNIPEETNGFSEKLDAFSAVGQPILDSIHKDMLITIREALQHAMASFMKQTNNETKAIGNRVDHIGNKLGNYTQAHNEVVDSHENLAEEIRNMKLKMADVEDRSCRNNVKFRGIPEMVSSVDLRPFLQKIIAELLPSTKSHELVIDRARRLPKPTYLPERVPRDIIAQIHFLHVKDQLMFFACQCE